MQARGNCTAETQKKCGRPKVYPGWHSGDRDNWVCDFGTHGHWKLFYLFVVHIYTFLFSPLVRSCVPTSGDSRTLVDYCTINQIKRPKITGCGASRVPAYSFSLVGPQSFITTRSSQSALDIASTSFLSRSMKVSKVYCLMRIWQSAMCFETSLSQLAALFSRTLQRAP